MSEKKIQHPQPPRLPKQSPPTPGSTSQAKNPTGQIVPLSPSTIANRYVVSTIPRPNYQRPPLGQPSYCSALAAPAPKQITPYTVEDPFGPIQTQKPSSSFSSGRERSPYVRKPFVQHISYIEPHLVHIKDPLALAMEVLLKGWHFLLKHLGKNIKFYKSILIQEKSTRVENIMNKKGDPSVVLYHKFIIIVLPAAKIEDIPQFLSNPQITKVQKSIIVIMTIWTPLRKFYFSKIRIMIIHVS